MRIALLCATRRGYRVLERLIRLRPDAELIVFSFREEAHEPPFLDDIQRLAEARGATFYEARQVGASKWTDFWTSTSIDLLLTVSWRYIIPREVYERARLGTFVLHDSLLPAYRGFAPTVWAIINGEDHTGVTLFEIAEGVDTGRIIAQQRVPIGADDTIADVMEHVTQTYLEVLAANLPRLLDAPQQHFSIDQEGFELERSNSKSHGVHPLGTFSAFFTCVFRANGVYGHTSGPGLPALFDRRPTSGLGFMDGSLDLR